MAIGSISTNYSGRTVDINIFGDINPSLRPIQNATLTFGDPSSYCTGVQKLAQRYMIALLTELGSQPYYPNFGTDFYGNIGSNATAGSLTHQFVFANTLVINAFKAYQTATANLPLDEQLNTAVLQSLNYVPGRLNLTVQLITLAGTTVNYILPLPLY